MGLDHSVYEPLDSQGGALRLLRLKAGVGRKIKCELIHTTLDEAKDQYEAVSYTWGEYEEADPIFICGERLPINLNLCLILHDLRSPEADRTLWIDAVCINQYDSTERGHQVQQMREIFANAQRVLFCISRPTEMTDLLMTALQQLHQNADGDCASETDLVQLYATWERVRTRLEDEHHAVDLRLRNGLEYVLGQPWFSRAWILQEVANAREALVYCGRRSAPAWTLVISPDLIHIRRPEIQWYQPVLELMPSPWRKYKQDDPNRDLFSLLRMFSTAEATEERDKIYALLGLCSDATSSTTLRTNYNGTIRDVIRSTISHMSRCDLHRLSEVPYDGINEFFDDLQSFGSMLMLRWAAKNGHDAVVRLLLEKGVDIDARDEGGRTALPIAAENGHEEVVRLLIDNGADINARDKGNRTTLPIAAEKGHEEIVRLLVSEVTNIDVRDTHGRTGLWWAASRGSETLTRLFLERNANINVRDSSGASALLIAIAKGHEAVVRLLVEKGADIEVGDMYGTTPLVIAATKGRETMVQLLVDKGVNIDAEDRYGQAALWYAAEHGHEVIVRLLLEKGADTKVRDKFGRTILWWADRNGFDTVINLLLDQGACQDNPGH